MSVTQGREVNSIGILLTLAIGAFSIGVTEFSPMGFLPQIAEGVAVSIPKAGLLVSGYAIGVMIGAPIMTLWLGRYSRRIALIALMSIFVMGNIMAAFASNYAWLMVARFITSLNHGAFFGIGSIVASSVVPKNRQAMAISMMFMGLTIANIFGVPFATWLGQNIGWRSSFLGISILGLITISALFLSIPKTLYGNRVDVRSELKELGKLPILLALLTTILSSGAMFTLYTYIAPVLIELNNATPNMITISLILIGIGFSLGNLIGGKVADIALIKGLIGVLFAQMFFMLIFPYVGKNSFGSNITLILWGMGSFGAVPFLQVLVMTSASKAPALASSVNIGAFNLGNALGAILGAFVIDFGFQYESVSIAGALLALAAIIVVLIQARLIRRNRLAQ